MKLSVARTAVVGLVLTAFLAFSGGIVLQPAAQAASAPSVADLKAQAIYFQQIGKVASRDLAVSSIASASSREGKLWGEFVSTWASTNKYLKINRSVPKGLPTKGHVFVVLGSALTKSGNLSAKLERRLKLALSALEKYPKSAVLVSGGAPRNGNTEAGVMSKWLIDNGVAESRILVEQKSTSTVSNATNSMAMLAKLNKYTSYTLITDSSHMRRSAILFAAAGVRVQEQTGKAWQIEPRANLAYMDMPEAGKEPLSASSVAYTAGNVASVFKLYPQYQALVASPPATPVLTALEVVAPKDLTYKVGQRLANGGVVVRAIYSKGVYAKVVTTSAKVAGFDASKVGKRKATVTYTDAKVTKTAAFAYSVVKASSKVSVSLSTTKVKRNRTRLVVSAKITTGTSPAEPKGKVRFYLDGKQLKTVTVGAGGKAKFKLPKLGRTGQRVIVVKYSGDSLLKSATKKVKITVKR